MNRTKLTSKTTTEYILLTLLATRSDPANIIKQRLNSIGCKIPFGTLYPLLRELNKKKFLIQGHEQMDDTSVRKTYSITETGKQRLLELERVLTKLNKIIRRAKFQPSPK